MKEELIIPEGKEQYTLDFIRTNNALFLEEDENQVTVAVTDKTSENAKEALKYFHKKKIVFKNISQSKLAHWIGKKDGLNEENKKNISEENNNSIDDISKDAPVINLVNSICIEAIKNSASDIHIESLEKKARVRFRINGKLNAGFTIEKEVFEKVSSRIKLISGMNILEHRLPQDGRISVKTENKTSDLRVSVLPSSTGESIVMRLLSREDSFNSIEELGFLLEQVKDIRKMLSIPHGLILVSGPTGSGKTTTLHSMIKEIADEKIKVISIEDPVEFKIEGVNQIQVNEEIGLTFSSILRRVLRQDPDVIMIGEIRDKETASLAVRAALTGHLVLSTVHTNDALSCIERLKNLGIPSYLTAAVLKGSISQRLVMSKNNKRTVIAEEFFTDENFSDLISKECSKKELKSFLKKRDCKFLKDIALFKIKKGLVKKEDVLKEIEI